MSSEKRYCGLHRRAALVWLLGMLFLPPLVAQQGEIKRQAVESSVLASVGYDAKRRFLEIEFHSGAIYRYLEVPEEIHKGLLAAESKGRYFGASIRDKFKTERVNPDKEK
jgi:hypothetical protein